MLANPWWIFLEALLVAAVFVAVIRSRARRSSTRQRWEEIRVQLRSETPASNEESLGWQVVDPEIAAGHVLQAVTCARYLWALDYRAARELTRERAQFITTGDDDSG